MTTTRRRLRTLCSAVALLATLVPAPTATAATLSTSITVSLPASPQPAPALGYNLAHFTVGSNAADWWAYSGLAYARAFISPSDIEPNDDLGSTGDGVRDLVGFQARRSALRAAAVARGATDATYVNWSSFLGRYVTASGKNNDFTVDGAFRPLRAQGVDILVNLTASPSRFPIASTGDWANKWELWQHYYAQAFLMARDYGIHRYGIFNEPNNWTPSISSGDWLERLKVCSDALRSGFADARARDPGTLGSLDLVVYAPNTASGASKYLEWGQPAVRGLHTTYAGAGTSGDRLFDVYNYQKYSMTATGTATSYADDATTLTSYIARDSASTGDTPPPLALTEFNVRTGSDYDATPATLDTPTDFSQLGANAVTVASRGVRQVFLFKFGQTDRAGTYPVAKNGTHYVQNVAAAHRYGGATKGAEVWRLFNGACGPGLVMHTTTPSRAALFALACRPAGGGPVDLFIANPSADSHSLTVNLGALAPNGARVVVTEVSANASGGVTARATVGSNGKLSGLTIPPRTVWRVHAARTVTTPVFVDADADAMLGDGTASTTAGGTVTTLRARADGTVDGRRVAVVGFPLSASATSADRVLLSLTAANDTTTGVYQAHVYAIEGVAWSEGTLTWATAPFLLQGVGAGNQIANDVVARQGATDGTVTRIVGQLVTTSTTLATRQLDVTRYVRARALAGATRLTFLIVQDHRWDTALPSLSTGDTQATGIRISSRETGAMTGPRLELIP